MISPRLPVRIIVNPNAGAKAGIATNSAGYADIEAAVVDHALPCDIVTTEGPGHALELARAAVAAGCEVVVAAGGDGTVREIVPALMGTGVTLGILPLGSAMNTARSLDIPRDLDAAVKLIRQATRVEAIDIGAVHDSVFLEMAGAGIMAGVMRLLSDIDSGRWYRVRLLMHYLRLARGTRLEIDIDGERHRFNTLSVIVANGPFTGLGIPVAPGALMNDGEFEVRIFRAGSKRQLAASWLRVLLGRAHHQPSIAEFKTRAVALTARRQLLVHSDDELVGRTPATFELKPRAVSVIVGENAPALLDTGAMSATAAQTARPEWEHGVSRRQYEERG